MTHTYQTHGTCSHSIDFEIDDDGIIRSVRFNGGCPGNTTGIGALVVGMHKDEVIRRLSGIPCRGKVTSCPDQLARALAEV